MWHGLRLASAAPSTSQTPYSEGQVLGSCRSGQNQGQGSRKIRPALEEGCWCLDVLAPRVLGKKGLGQQGCRQDLHCYEEHEKSHSCA